MPSTLQGVDRKEEKVLAGSKKQPEVSRGQLYEEPSLRSGIFDILADGVRSPSIWQSGSIFPLVLKNICFISTVIKGLGDKGIGMQEEPLD